EAAEQRLRVLAPRFRGYGERPVRRDVGALHDGVADVGHVRIARLRRIGRDEFVGLALVAADAVREVTNKAVVGRAAQDADTDALALLGGDGAAGVHALRRLHRGIEVRQLEAQRAGTLGKGLEADR